MIVSMEKSVGIDEKSDRFAFLSLEKKKRIARVHSVFTLKIVICKK